MRDRSWKFDANYPGATVDEIYGFDELQKIYTKADPKITTSVTMPILWDKKSETIVNNESSEIIRMFNSSFDQLTGNKDDYYSADKRHEIDQLNEEIYNNVNNGVYLCGFAKTQEVYDEAVCNLFSTLDKLEERLSENKFLLGDEITEADLRLIPTLLRFDIVYVTHFKCNVRRIKDYKNLSQYTKELYEMDAIKSTTNFDHIKRPFLMRRYFMDPLILSLFSNVWLIC